MEWEMDGEGTKIKRSGEREKKWKIMINYREKRGRK